MIRFIVIFYF